MRPQAKKVILVAGTGRSGTTWVADVLATGIKARTVFEPFLINSDCNYVLANNALQGIKSAPINSDNILWNYSLYLPKKGKISQALKDQIAFLLYGNANNAWCDLEGNNSESKILIIKEIRANLMLEYIAEVYNDIEILFLIRNPIAVVNSMIEKAKKGWHFDCDMKKVLNQDALICDYLYDFSSYYTMNLDHLYRLIHRWCIENYVPIEQNLFNGKYKIRLLHYENIASDYSQINDLAVGLFGDEWDSDSAYKAWNKPSWTSSTLTKSINNTSNLCSANIDTIIKVAGLYNLDGFIRQLL